MDSWTANPNKMLNYPISLATSCHNVTAECDIIHELTQQDLNLATLQIMSAAIPARTSSRISGSESPLPQLRQHPTYNSTEDCKANIPNDAPNGITSTLCGSMCDFLAGCPIRELLGVRNNLVPLVKSRMPAFGVNVARRCLKPTSLFRYRARLDPCRMDFGKKLSVVNIGLYGCVKFVVLFANLALEQNLECIKRRPLDMRNHL